MINDMKDPRKTFGEAVVEAAEVNDKCNSPFCRQQFRFRIK
jgi:hypothetical protein